MFFSVVNPWGCARLFGVLLGRQSERVPTHGVHDTCTLHTLIAADDIGCRIPLGMTNMEPVSAGVREHVQGVEFFRFGEPRGGECVYCLPSIFAIWVRLPLDYSEAWYISVF